MIQKYNKLYVVLVTVAAMLVTQGVVTGTAATVANAIIAAAGAFGVYQIPNKEV